jgi:hypothetical protein
VKQVTINEEWIMAKVKMLEDDNARLRAALSERDALLGEADTVLNDLYGNMPDGVNVVIGEWQEKYARLKSAGEEGA